MYTEDGRIERERKRKKRWAFFWIRDICVVCEKVCGDCCHRQAAGGCWRTRLLEPGVDLGVLVAGVVVVLDDDDEGDVVIAVGAGHQLRRDVLERGDACWGRDVIGGGGVGLVAEVLADRGRLARVVLALHEGAAGARVPVEVQAVVVLDHVHGPPRSQLDRYVDVELVAADRVAEQVFQLFLRDVCGGAAAGQAADKRDVEAELCKWVHGVCVERGCVQKEEQSRTD